MTKYTYPEAKKLIQPICQAAKNGEYDTREKFMTMLDENPSIAAQGYNAFGKIFFWNAASTLLYGYSEHAAVNQDLFELILPDELRPFARDMVQMARNTGKFPEAGSCDLLQRNGEFVTVYSGHVVFQWDEGSEPEFYCIDVAIDPSST
jgi:PAS domain-containing protein